MRSVPPPTGPIPTGLRARIQPRRGLRRLRESALPIIQIVVAATCGYAFARYVLGHGTPLLAATVTVSSLGLVRDARPRRVLETVIGMLVGILIAECLYLTVGTGWWQLALALGLTLVVARSISAQASFAIAAALQSLIVMVIPPQGPFLRVIDGVVGAVCALLATALIPRSTLRPVAADASRLLREMFAAAATTVQGLSTGSRERAERGLAKARALQAPLDDWRAALDSAVSISRISPFLRRERSELHRLSRMLTHLDFATRNLRVVARRAVYLCDDAHARPDSAAVLDEIARGIELIEDSVPDISLEIGAREALRVIAAHLDPATVAGSGTVGDQALVGAMRPLVVDLLSAAGEPPENARASLPRI